MARVFIDGFESGDGGLWNNFTGAVFTTAYAESQGISLTGTYCWRLGSADQPLPDLGTVCIGFRIGVATSAVDTIPGINFLYNGTVQAYARFKILSTSLMEVWIHDGDSIVNNYFYVPTENAVHIQVKFVNVNATSKTMAIKLDDTLVLDEAFNAHFAVSGVTNTVSANVTGSYNFMDDFVIDDSDWTGLTRIAGFAPTADGDSSEWTPSISADHYTLVDETPPNTTDYVESGTPDAIDLFTFQPMIGEQIIKSVQSQAYGSCAVGDSYKLCVKTSGEVHYGCSGEYNGGSYKQAHHLWDDNPATSGEWTFNEVNSIQSGVVFMEV